MSNLKLGQKEI